MQQVILKSVYDKECINKCSTLGLMEVKKEKRRKVRFQFNLNLLHNYFSYYIIILSQLYTVCSRNWLVSWHNFANFLIGKNHDLAQLNLFPHHSLTSKFTVKRPKPQHNITANETSSLTIISASEELQLIYKGWIQSSGNTAVTWRMCVGWHYCRLYLIAEVQLK